MCNSFSLSADGSDRFIHSTIAIPLPLTKSKEGEASQMSSALSLLTLFISATLAEHHSAYELQIA